MKIWTILEENIWFLGLKLYQKIFHQWFVGGKMWRKLFFYPFSQKSRTIGRFSIEKVFLEISQNSQENTCARVSFLIKLQAEPARVQAWGRSFPVNFAKFLREPFLTEYLQWLLLVRFENILITSNKQHFRLIILKLAWPFLFGFS